MKRRTSAVVVGLILTGCVWRIVNARFSLAPNVEVLTAASFAAAMVTTSRLVALLPAAVACLSDAVIGNSLVLIFTWTAWLLVGAAAVAGRRIPPGHRYFGSVIFGSAVSMMFFLWTNFGVWALGDGMAYPHTLAGLIESYVAGIPFFRTMLVANLVLPPAVYAVTIALTGRNRMKPVPPARAAAA